MSAGPTGEVQQDATTGTATPIQQSFGNRANGWESMPRGRSRARLRDGPMPPTANAHRTHMPL
jgi:hypothetical protein